MSDAQDQQSQEAGRPFDGGPTEGVTRRGILSGAALLGANAGLEHVLGRPARRTPGGRTARPAGGDVVAFYGPHQAGIATAAQDYLHFAAFDVTSDRIQDLRSLLERWTAVAARLTAGAPYEPGPQQLSQPPEDTGEAIGLGPARLTLTFGFGPSLFDSARANTLGLTRSRPAELRVLPPFRGERLDPRSSGGDLCVQACADDPQVAFHAIHELSRVAAGVAVPRWSQQGFGRTSSTSRSQRTQRNLIGFKDGTDNLRSEDTSGLEEYVWIAPGGQEPRWLAGGTYLIARRVRILFDSWDATSLDDQQRTIGREKLSGAPLGASAEYDPVNLIARSADGELVIPANAHIRLASPQNNGGQAILRRGYSYGEGIEPGTGQIDAGLFFIAFQRSPRRQFIPLQRRLAAQDALSRFTVHTASSIFACPPGALPGGFVGGLLFE